MHKVSPFLALAVVLSLPLSCLRAQDAADALHAPDGNAREMVQSIFITAIPNAPFQAVLRAEFTKHLPDGSTQTRWNHRLIVRDSQGRIYQERRTFVPEGSSHQPGVYRIEISNPAAHTKYFCDAELARCELRDYSPPSLEPTIAAGPLDDGKRYLSRASLGTKTIEGVDVIGTRETVTVGQNTAGNTAPIDFTKEFWYSPKLGINLQVSRFDPLHGDQIFTATSLNQSEPDARLLRLPASTKVNDLRQSPAPVKEPAAGH